jgi:hypothetical protein
MYAKIKHKLITKNISCDIIYTWGFTLLNSIKGIKYIFNGNFFCEEKIFYCHIITRLIY